jgi:hypothetical protein
MHVHIYPLFTLFSHPHTLDKFAWIYARHVSRRNEYINTLPGDCGILCPMVYVALVYLLPSARDAPSHRDGDMAKWQMSTLGRCDVGSKLVYCPMGHRALCFSDQCLKFEELLREYLKLESYRSLGCYHVERPFREKQVTHVYSYGSAIHGFVAFQTSYGSDRSRCR